jgi:hypothetical protein
VALQFGFQSSENNGQVTAERFYNDFAARSSAFVSLTAAVVNSFVCDVMS